MFATSRLKKDLESRANALYLKLRFKPTVEHFSRTDPSISPRGLVDLKLCFKPKGKRKMRYAWFEARRFKSIPTRIYNSCTQQSASASGFPMWQITTVPDWGQVCMFQGKNGQDFRAFTRYNTPGWIILR